MPYNFDTYVRSNHVCFYMGKYLDEAYRLIRIVVSEQPMAESAHEVGRELRDLESMGREFFEDELEPALKKLNVPGTYYSSDVEESVDNSCTFPTTDLLPPKPSGTMISTGSCPCCPDSELTSGSKSSKG